MADTENRREWFKAGIDAAIEEISSGRTINNFGHVPEVRRALEWVVMDLKKMRDEKALVIPK